MGIWGDGNFDDDSALNMLAVWQQKMINTIRETFTNDSDDSGDTIYERHGDSHIVANVDILTTLYEHYGTCPDLELEEVSKWKQDYINTYDRYCIRFTRLEDKEGLKKRREVVENTFDKLYALVKNFHED